MTGASRPQGRAGCRSRGATALLASLALLVTGCLSFDEPTPSPAEPTPTPTPSETQRPRDPAALVIAAPADPAGLLPPGEDETTALLVDLLYDPLYRLDEHLEPQPVLAAALPSISPDGLTWSIDLASDGLRFQDGTPLTAADVAFSLQIAASSACTLGRDLCNTVSAHLADVTAGSTSQVTITLDAPFAPFLAEALGQLPILSHAAVTAETGGIVVAARDLDPSEADRLVARIENAITADACLVAVPPFGCRLADHLGELETTLQRASVPLPAREIYTDMTGTFDAQAYAGALYDRVAVLGQVLNSTGIDRMAAALPLLNPARRPLGSGPFRLVSYSPGDVIELDASTVHVGGTPAIPHISIQITRDAATGATRLLTGEVDWLLKVQPDQLAKLQGATNVRLAQHPLRMQRTIVFNVRAGRVYSDAQTRKAFASCLDRDGLAAAATGGAAIVATTPVAAGSWAMTPHPSPPRDVAAGRGLLASAGWTPGDDGILVRGAQRLSSEIAVRPSRSDLVAFAQGAAVQLKECGIELVVRDLDLTGDLMLTQLQWPNDFDTVLISRPLGVDPDRDMESIEGAHATTPDNPSDANPGGFASAAADQLIAAARAASTQDARAARYVDIQALFGSAVPAWPLWYDTSWAAVAMRLQGPDGPVDPGRPRYSWNVASWWLGSAR